MNDAKIQSQPAQGASSEGVLVTKAVVRAARLLGISNKNLATIIGVSEPSASRMTSGAYTVTPGEKPFELAVLLIRLYRSLDAISGGDDEVSRAWLRNDNTALGAVPLDMVRKIEGLVSVISYLDARRARV